MPFDRVQDQAGEGKQPYEQPKSHCCIGLVAIILLGFFAHFYTYSVKSDLVSCYADSSTGEKCNGPDYTGCTNVTIQWQNLMLVGMVWTSVQILSVLFIFFKIKFLVGIGLFFSCLGLCTNFAWLITTTIFRWNASGRTCSGDGLPSQADMDSYLIVEGKFLKNLTLSMWGIPAGMLCLACLCTFSACLCKKKN